MSAVIISLRVAATPEETFDIFTGEIGSWWRPGALFQITPRGDGTLSFEDRARLVTTLPNGKVFEIGRVHVWLRGERLAFSWRQATFTPDQVTEVDIRFERAGAETRITVEHRGWDTIPQDHVARHGFPLQNTQMHLATHWRTQLARLAQLAGP
ncbi:MAG TPA: SRPBCC domain-containing protein [Hyphomonas sp.]|nr:SRPBCC domain-containing protein [Hyphomonas sp.]HRX75806.1 SRPBCC domain-containing protein [Hyphomonas sp.]